MNLNNTKKNLAQIWKEIESNEPILKIATEKIPDNFEQTLKLTKQKNKLLKHLNRHKSPNQIVQERLEQGFSLYYSGANRLKNKRNKAITYRDRQQRPEIPNAATMNNLSESSTNQAKKVRKNWNIYSNCNNEQSRGKLALFTSRGDFAAPKLAFSYSDDFDESDASTVSSETENDEQSEHSKRVQAESGQKFKFHQNSENFERFRLSKDDLIGLRKSININPEKKSVEKIDEIIEEEITDVSEFDSDTEEDEIHSEEQSISEDFSEISSSIAKKGNLMINSSKSNENRDIKKRVLDCVPTKESSSLSVKQNAEKEFILELPIINNKLKSQNSNNLNEIIGKIQRMSDSQKKILANHLSEAINVGIDDKEISESRKSNSDQENLLEDNEETESLYQNHRQFDLDIINNWGHDEFVGLNEIQFFNKSNQKIDIEKIELIRNNRIEGTVRQLTNDRPDSIRSSDNWSTRLVAADDLSSQSSQDCPIKLKITLEENANLQLSTVKVWNFNGSLANLNRGARHVRLMLSHSGQTLFKGELNKGSGLPGCNTCTLINVDEIPCKSASFSVGKSNSLLNQLNTQQTNTDVNANEKNTFELQRESENTAELRRKDFGQLEKSWTSLSIFDKLHAGRISSADFTSTMSIDKSSNGDATTPISTKPKSLFANLNESQNDCMNGDESLDLCIEKLSAAARPNNHSQNVSKSYAKEDASTTKCQFLIPELPTGKLFTLLIHSTWGDRHYVGLTGIEIFNVHGQRISSWDFVEKIRADPANINILPGYGSDPRVVENLIDGHNKTCDDVHMWLTPFFGSQRSHLVELEFQSAQELAMIRIWNYNKSRIHTSRGARDIEVWVDNECIFRGELERATGGIQNELEMYGDTILLTQDDKIMEKIAENDFEYQDHIEQQQLQQSLQTRKSVDESSGIAGQSILSHFMVNDSIEEQESKCSSDSSIEKNPSSRPMTSILNGIKKPKSSLPPSSISKPLISSIQIELIDNWNSTDYIGLTELQLFNEKLEQIPIKSITSSSVSSSHTLYPSNGSLKNLHNGHSITTDTSQMCCWQISKQQSDSNNAKNDASDMNCSLPILLQIELLDATSNISKLRVWNYNSNKDESYQGVKLIRINFQSDCNPATSRQYLLRRAPGHTHFDFGQQLNLDSEAQTSHTAISNIPVPVCEPKIVGKNIPCGFTIQMSLYNAWADHYYIGLDAIELFELTIEDTTQQFVLRPIFIQSHQISAHPASINALCSANPTTDDCRVPDQRTPDKLIIDKHENSSNPKCWLAPILPGVLNKLFVTFGSGIPIGANRIHADEDSKPRSIAAIRFANYSKTPARGVRDFSVLIDDVMVFHGQMPRCPKGSMFTGQMAPWEKAYHNSSCTNSSYSENDFFVLLTESLRNSKLYRKVDDNLEKIKPENCVHMNYTSLSNVQASSGSDIRNSLSGYTSDLHKKSTKADNCSPFEIKQNFGLIDENREMSLSQLDENLMGLTDRAIFQQKSGHRNADQSKRPTTTCKTRGTSRAF